MAAPGSVRPRSGFCVPFWLRCCRTLDPGQCSARLLPNKWPVFEPIEAGRVIRVVQLYNAVRPFWRRARPFVRQRNVPVTLATSLIARALSGPALHRSVRIVPSECHPSTPRQKLESLGIFHSTRGFPCIVQRNGLAMVALKQTTVKMLEQCVHLRGSRSSSALKTADLRTSHAIQANFRRLLKPHREC